MATNPQPTREPGGQQASSLVLVDEVLVDQIWREAQGRVGRTQIHQLVTEAVSEFAEATIKTYVPIFVRRQVDEKLRAMLGAVETTQDRTAFSERVWARRTMESVAQPRQIDLVKDL